ncbi:LOB domain-containing 20 [Olea europaea subsp. europaea]|uniref:LOB domain-containing 20 n=1 Tax=Olea europaea subsp. europaea TaxID=158383 RepID=A0A8S0VBP0_OLEEU|nr:LOB domain-containing 20 [Olea europaea subsp. europaea]
MDGSQGDGTSRNRRKGSGKRAEMATGSPRPLNAPCGACKFLRRKCIIECVFAPHFGSDQGAARFAAVHKVFGARNVSKLLLHIPANWQHDAVVTISYEAQARLSDPVYGCVSTIIALQQQVASLQEELSLVQTHLINSRYAMVNALQNSPSQPQHHQQQHVSVLQPAYSNTSSASNNNLININNFSTTTSLEQTAAPSNSLEPSRRTFPSGQDDEEEEEEEDDESRDPIAFTNQIFH